MSVDLDVAGSEDDAIARNFLVLPQVDNVSHLSEFFKINVENARDNLAMHVYFVIDSMSLCLENQLTHRKPSRYVHIYFA